MLGVGEASRTLDYLKEKRNIYYDANKHERWALEAYGYMKSSPNLDILPDHCDITDENYAARFQLSIFPVSKEEYKPSPNDRKESLDKGPGNTKVINFAELKCQKVATFEFAKEKIEEAPTTTSALRAIFPPVQRPKMINLKIFIKDEGRDEKLRVPVPENSKVAQVIELIKKKVEEEKKPLLVGSYNLKIAEEEGEEEDDLPALQDDQLIHKLGTCFCLVPNAEELAARRASLRGTTKLVKVQLSNEQYQMVAFNPDMKISALLRKVCERKHLNTMEYAFTIQDGSEELNKSYVPLDMTLKELDQVTNGQCNIMLKRKETIDKLADTTKSEKAYNVVKLKRFNVGQERLLIISPDIITNHAPKQHVTKRPTRLIRDLRKVQLTDKKPRQFQLQYEGETKVYTYKAKTEAEAREIVNRLQMYQGKTRSPSTS